MYLVDTNVWLERLLDQARSAEVGQFLVATASDQLLMSDFTLHSIGIILDRLGQRAILPRFIDDLFVEGEVTLVSVPPQAMRYLVATMYRFNLDFDDAYQYVAAEQSSATIVSFDGDFDRTDRGRQAPADALAASQGAER
jgi:predicted nucleic acid-binding protein